MKHRYSNIFGLIMIVIGLTFSSCEQDNYSLPQGGIKGSVLDSSNNPIQTEQPGGIKIRMIELKYGDGVTPNDFWCKADGTFVNEFVFEGKYKVVPIEGAFFPVDPVEVNISGVTNVDFKVVPYLKIEATASLSGGNVVVSYKLSRERVGGKITEVKTLVSSYPTVSNTINEKSITHNLSGTDDVSILATNYTDTVTGLSSGKTYYIRVGAIAVNSYNKFNYSAIFEIKIP